MTFLKPREEEHSSKLLLSCFRSTSCSIGRDGVLCSKCRSCLAAWGSTDPQVCLQLLLLMLRKALKVFQQFVLASLLQESFKSRLHSRNY